MQRYRSNIFWHFTGSPKGINWSEVKKPTDILDHGSPLDDHDALDVALKILESSILLGTCSEHLSENDITEKFCCVTDIPMKDLYNHAKYYGKVAIGFSAQSIYEKFLPVTYVPLRHLPASEKKIIPDQEALDYAEYCMYNGNLHDADYYEHMAYTEYGREVISAVDKDKVGSVFTNFLKLTEFGLKGEDTFYSEREWRHIGDYKFSPHDIEVVVAPKELLNGIYEFLSSGKSGVKLGGVSVVSWELVVGA